MKTHKDKASRKYAAIEKGAAMRGIEFDITFAEYTGTYFEKPCHYCGIIAIGLDRICSADGYNTANNEYNRAETAKSLGISTTTLWRKIKHFNLTNAK